MMDWKDVLSQMKSDLPEGEEREDRDERKEREGKSEKLEKLSVAMERKGRGGKTATIIFGFEGSDEDVASVASRLKQRLGIGGSARGGEILLQGDVREKVKPLLRELGYRI